MNTTQPSSQSESHNNRARIFLVEAQPLFRYGLKSWINQQPDLAVVGEAANATEAAAGIAASQPNLVTVELTLKAANGMELIKRLRSQNASVGILVISAQDELLNAELALHAGANGYLMKDAAVEEVLVAIRRVLEGKVYLSEKMTYNLLAQRSRKVAAAEASPVSRLSNREREVLLLIGQWRRTREIAEDIHLSIKTVEYYRSRIRSKLNLTSSNDLVRFATNWILDRQHAGKLPATSAESENGRKP